MILWKIAENCSQDVMEHLHSLNILTYAIQTIKQIMGNQKVLEGQELRSLRNLMKGIEAISFSCRSDEHIDFVNIIHLFRFHDV